MKTLLHWLRLIFEPNNDGLLARQPRRWFVRYPDGARSIPMGYRTAHDYRAIYGGTVERHRDK